MTQWKNNLELPNDEPMLIVRPCYMHLCWKVRPAAKLLSVLLYHARNEQGDTFTIGRTQEEMADHDMCEEITCKTLADTAIPALVLFGFIDIDMSTRTFQYTLHLNRVREAITAYKESPTSLEKVLKSYVTLSLEKLLIQDWSLEKVLIVLRRSSNDDKKKFLRLIELVLMILRKSSQATRGRKRSTEVTLEAIFDDTEILESNRDITENKGDSFGNSAYASLPSDDLRTFSYSNNDYETTSPTPSQGDAHDPSDSTLRTSVLASSTPSHDLLAPGRHQDGATQTEQQGQALEPVSVDPLATGSFEHTESEHRANATNTLHHPGNTLLPDLPTRRPGDLGTEQSSESGTSEQGGDVNVATRTLTGLDVPEHPAPGNRTPLPAGQSEQTVQEAQVRQDTNDTTDLDTPDYTPAATPSPLAPDQQGGTSSQASATLSPPVFPSSSTPAEAQEKPKRGKQQAKIIPIGPPVMPALDVKWCAEVAVEIVEAKKGRRYGETTRAQELTEARKVLKLAYTDTPITREQFEQAWDDMASWAFWKEHTNVKPMIKTLRKDDKIITILEELAVKSRKNGNKPAQNGHVGNLLPLSNGNGYKPHVSTLQVFDEAAYQRLKREPV